MSDYEKLKIALKIAELTLQAKVAQQQSHITYPEYQEFLMLFKDVTNKAEDLCDD